MALLQIQTTPLGHSLPSLATLMFNRPIQGIMPVTDCKPLVEDCDGHCHAKIFKTQQKNDNNTAVTFLCIPIGPAVVVQSEDGGPWTHWTVVGTGNHNHHKKIIHNTIDIQWQMHHMQ